VKFIEHPSEELLRKSDILKRIFLTIKPSFFRDRDLEDSLQARKVFLLKE
jgi:hypothetical protein